MPRSHEIEIVKTHSKERHGVHRGRVSLPRGEGIAVNRRLGLSYRGHKHKDERTLSLIVDSTNTVSVITKGKEEPEAFPVPADMTGMIRRDIDLTSDTGRIIVDGSGLSIVPMIDWTNTKKLNLAIEGQEELKAKKFKSREKLTDFLGEARGVVVSPELTSPSDSENR